MAETILLLQFGDLGDTILTVPAIRALRSRYPDSRLVLMGKRTAIDFIVPLGLVDDTVEVQKHLFDSTKSLINPAALFELCRVLVRLRRRKIGTAVLFHHLVTRWGALKFALLLSASGARRRFGVDNGRGWFLTHSVRDQGFGAMHEAQYWLEVARLLDATSPLVLEAPVTAADRRAAEKMLAACPSGSLRVALHPGAGWYGPGRRWSPRGFVRTARLLASHGPVSYVVVGSEEDLVIAEPVAAELGCDAINLIGKTSVGELAAVLELCDALVATDGGVAHLAAAVGTLSVTIFGPSNDRAWRPVGGTVVASDLPCRPCFYRDFERGLPAGCRTRECMSAISPRAVADAVLAGIAETAVAG